MYENLVKRLLSYADLHCPLDMAAGICGCIDAREAADAIEEMDTLLDGVSADNDALCETIERLKKPSWIPVTDEKRLPRDGSNVIVCTKSGNVGEAKYQAASDYDLDYPAIWFLLNDYGNQYQTEELIAWQPLPEPPKEET